MIPAFLKELAALIRHRIAAGQAVHVTELTAQELDLLAGLPWDDDRPRYWTYDEVRHDVMPADIVRGWLVASKAQSSTVYLDPAKEPATIERVYGADLERAAVCAELVALAAQVGRMPVVFVEPNDTMRQKYQDILRDFGSGAISIMTEPVEFIPGGVFPYDGTRDGARAAWGFIAENLPQLKQHFDLRQTYLRELEAMK